MLDGVDLSNWYEKPNTDSYEERLKKGEEPLWEFLENLYPEEEKKNALYDILCKAILINQEVYTEVGIRLGARLVFELLQSNSLNLNYSC